MPYDRVPKILLLFVSLFAVCSPAAIFGQSAEERSRNNPYSSSPPTKEIAQAVNDGIRPLPTTSVGVTAADASQDDKPKPKVLQISPSVTAPNDANKPPTQIYKIGAGDVLMVILKNAQNVSGYYTVQQDGMIDFPLAGDNVVVGGKTVDEAAKTVARRITLYSQPEVEIKVREYASHKITVSGLVERPGERSIQREAVPLFVVRAEAGATSGATQVNIRRAAGGPVETHLLGKPETDNILIYPGNSVEFAPDPPGFYYISGAVVSVGQKELVAGMTLFQAITASGGTKGDAKKAIVRRKTDDGLLWRAEHDLKAIKAGKSPDPPLLRGDIIEIGN